MTMVQRSVVFHCSTASWEQFPGPRWSASVAARQKEQVAPVLPVLFSLGALDLRSGATDPSIGTVTACFLALAEGAVCVAPAC